MSEKDKDDDKSWGDDIEEEDNQSSTCLPDSLHYLDTDFERKALLDNFNSNFPSRNEIDFVSRYAKLAHVSTMAVKDELVDTLLLFGKYMSKNCLSILESMEKKPEEEMGLSPSPKEAVVLLLDTLTYLKTNEALDL